MLDILGAVLGCETLSGVAKPEKWLVEWATAGRETASGELVSEDTALTCSAVKAAVCLLAETVADLPLDIFEKVSSSKRRDATEHSTQTLVDRAPNQEMTAFTWKETSQGHLGTWGNSYSEIQRTIGGEVVALWPRSPRPGRTKPVRRDDGKVWYECRDEHGAREPDIAAEDMLHILGFGFDGLCGYSPIGLAREAIGGNKAAERFANELFKNAANTEGHYKHPGKLSQAAYARLTSQLATYSSQGKRHGRPILEEGLDFASTSMHPEDVQMIEERRFGVEEIARFYRISPTLLQDLSRGTFSNITELGRQFIVFTMAPWLSRWEAEINRKLLKPPFYCKFNVKKFMRGDPVAQADYYAKLFGIGAKSINDILALEDENDIGEEGDVRFVPSNMVTLERAINPPEPPKPAPPQFAPPPDEEETPDEPPKEEGMAADVARQWLSETMTRLAKVEIHEATRAAQRPDAFVSKVEAFYAGFGATLAGAIAAPCSVLGLLPETVAAEHCTASQSALLAAAECQPEELAVRVAECVEAWHGT